MMNRILIALRRTMILALCMVILPFAAPAQAASKNLTVSFSVATYQNRARSALKDINVLRKKKGVDPLVMLADLEKVAIQRAAELFVFFDHDRPNLTDYDTADDEYKSVKTCLATAECIAAGYSSADDVVADWEDNALTNLIDPDFTHAGLACVYVKGSRNEYYWVLYLQQQPEAFKATAASSTAKAGTAKSMKVEIKKGMYARADKSHRSFKLQADDVNLKTKTSAEPTVYLYDQYNVKIGKVALENLTFKSSNTSVFTVLQSGTIKRKKAGTGTLTIKADGLDSIQCAVTIGSGASAATAASASVTASTIKDAEPTLTAKEYTKHTSLSVYLKGSSGYVLYRATSKTGSYTKVDEAATTKRWTCKLEHEDLTRNYYYKVRAYKNSNGKRVYSEYSTPVKVTP